MMKNGDEKKHIRTFGFGLTGLLSAIACLQLYKGHYGNVKYYFIASFVVLCVSFAAPIGLKPVYIPMMFAARVLGWFNTRVLLGIIFFLVFSPIGLFLRLIRKDLLERKIGKSCESYWCKRDNSAVEFDRYKQQF